MSFLTNLLERYRLTLQDLRARSAPGSFRRLRVPDSLPDFASVVSRLKKAIEHHEKVVIYGDYDVDGLTSTAILKLALKEAGSEVGFFVPSRYVEGYGLEASRVRQFREKGYQLIVLVDNGVRCFDSVRLARELGMDVVAIDHHLPDSTLPSLSALFHHRLSGFLDYDCSAASLCYFVARSLLGRDDPYLAFLAGLAVFSDCMPLVGNNLEFAKIALLSQNRLHFPNVSLLLPERATFDDLVFRLIPALNAVGRIQEDSLSTNRACWFLIRWEDSRYAKEAAQWLEETNRRRKDLVRQIVPSAGKSLSTAGGRCLVIEAPSGIAGLYANRLLREIGLPVAVFARSEARKGCLVGSLRAPEGYRLMDFLGSLKKAPLAFGGHPLACGVTIEERDYFQFATSFLSYVEKTRLEGLPPAAEPIDITLEDLTAENYAVLEQFEPFGVDFPRPSFALTCSVEDLRQGNGYFFVASPDCSAKAICFQPFDKVHREQSESAVFVGSFSCDEFRGKRTYVLKAESYREE